MCQSGSLCLSLYSRVRYEPVDRDKEEEYCVCQSVSLCLSLYIRVRYEPVDRDKEEE